MVATESGPEPIESRWDFVTDNDGKKWRMSNREKQAVERVLRAGVKAPIPVIRDWVQCVGPELILSAKLCDIRAVANAF